MGVWSWVKGAVGRPARRESGLEVSRYIAAPPRRGTPQLLQAFREQPILRAIVEKISDNVAGAQWHVYKRVDASGRGVRDFSLRAAPPAVRHERIKAMLRTGEAVEVPDHPVLSLLADPNDYLTGRAVSKLAQVHIDIVGDAFLVKVRKGRVVVGLWPIPPSWVLMLPNWRLPRSEWVYVVQIAGVRQEVAFEDMIHMRNPDPDDPLGRGVGPAFTLGDELDTDEYISRFLKNSFWNNMVPASIIAIKGANDAPALKRFKAELASNHQGPDRAGKVLVTNGENLNHARLDTTFKDMELVKLREFLQDFVRMHYGIPPEVIGDVTNSNKATAFAAREILAEQVIVPRLEFWRSELQKRLMSDFSDAEAILDYDSPVPADRDHQLAVMSKMPEAFHYDEWRALAGFRPDPERNGYPMPLPGQKPGQNSPENGDKPAETDPQKPVIEGENDPSGDPAGDGDEPKKALTVGDPPWVRRPIG